MIHTKPHLDPYSSIPNNQNQRTFEKYTCRYAENMNKGKYDALTDVQCVKSFSAQNLFARMRIG